MNNPKDQTFFITGANGGIAIEVVKQLIAKQAKRIVLACRTAAKANDLRQTLLPLSQNTDLVAVGGFDMNDVDAIQAAVTTIALPEQIDVVFLQSGGVILSKQFEFTSHASQNIEKTVFQNALGGYVTYELLQQANLLADNAKVVFAGGEGARGIPGMIPKPVFSSDEAFLKYLHHGEEKYSFMRAIGVSKFASALLVQKLADNANGKEFIWFSPGLTGGTKGLDNVPNPRRFIMKHIGFPLVQLIGLAQGPKQAAQKYVDCLLGNVGHNGDILGAPEGKALGNIVDQKPMNPSLTNHQLREAIWQLANTVSRTVTAAQ